MATVHIESNKEDIAPIVLMPGDPKRSEDIAKKFLKEYKLVNSVRGMTAYTGYYKDTLVTIFPSGMGCPSMGIYSYELFKEYGVESIIRVGSCGAYSRCAAAYDVRAGTPVSDRQKPECRGGCGEDAPDGHIEVPSLADQTEQR